MSVEKRLANFLANLPAEAFVVAFYINNANNSQDEWMNPLAEYLREKGFFVIGIISESAKGKCRLDGMDVFCPVNDDFIRNLERVNVFIVIDVDFRTKFPQSSRVLGCTHGLTCADVNFSPYSMIYQLHNLSGLDGWLASFPLGDQTREITRKIWTGFLNPGAALRKNGDFHVIPMGYPRLAVISRQLAALESLSPDSIIFAPLGIKFQLDNGGERLEKFGLSAIDAILNAFPHKNLIFRPYKTDLESDIVKNICNEFTNHPRFILDKCPSRQNTFSRGTALVTDLSHIAQSFSFSTLRPSIFYQPWKNGMATRSWTGGYYSYDVRQLLECLESVFMDIDKISESIKKNRNSVIMPPEKSFEGIADCLEDFYNGKSRPDWLTIHRNGKAETKSDIELVNLMLDIPLAQRACFAAAAASFNDQYSCLLCACALHYGLQCFPQNYLYYDLEAVSKQLLGKNESIPCYYSVSAAEIEFLYNNAILKYYKKNESSNAKLIEMLLEEFTNIFVDKR